jgi:hypothetical protein
MACRLHDLSELCDGRVLSHSRVEANMETQGPAARAAALQIDKVEFDEDPGQERRPQGSDLPSRIARHPNRIRCSARARVPLAPPDRRILSWSEDKR